MNEAFRRLADFVLKTDDAGCFLCFSQQAEKIELKLDIFGCTGAHTRGMKVNTHRLILGFFFFRVFDALSFISTEAAGKG